MTILRLSLGHFGVVMCVCIMAVIVSAADPYSSFETTYEEANGEPHLLGIQFAQSMFGELNTEVDNDGKWCNDDGHCCCGHEIVIDFPDAAQTALPHFTFMMANWNPFGHPPPNIYSGIQHFDLHFYTMPYTERANMEAGSDCPVIMDPDAFCTSTKPLPTQCCPTGAFGSVGAVEPGMGNHMINFAAPEFNGGAFTSTWIWGLWDGRVAFFEPMITIQYYKDLAAGGVDASDCREIPGMPSEFDVAGYYPTAYCSTYNLDQDMFHTYLTNFTYFEKGCTDTSDGYSCYLAAPQAPTCALECDHIVTLWPDPPANTCDSGFFGPDCSVMNSLLEYFEAVTVVQNVGIEFAIGDDEHGTYIAILAGLFGSDYWFSVEQVDTGRGDEDPSANPPSGGWSDVGYGMVIHAFDDDNNLLSPNGHFEIIVNYDDIGLSTEEAGRAQLFYWDGSEWVASECDGVSTTVNAAQSSITFFVCHLSQFNVFLQAAADPDTFSPDSFSFSRDSSPSGSDESSFSNVDVSSSSSSSNGLLTSLPIVLLAAVLSAQAVVALMALN
eukprot:TRINITY_DN8743_c0_g1_i1.p1 TRINITY_DN8743_c0_g1~~TRINITY_DN8743_c0_g1_i1.p1  ORF type:complete len:577 (+),score=118.77 TRINITY_DN8743_c0_g1_i1:74-1732(+)